MKTRGEAECLYIPVHIYNRRTIFDRFSELFFEIILLDFRNPFCALLLLWAVLCIVGSCFTLLFCALMYCICMFKCIYFYQKQN